MQSQHFEDFEINFAAFVISARTVTFVLQKEFHEKKEFIAWYGDPTDPQDGKALEMKNDDLCKFFVKVRNSIEKEGITGLNCSTHIDKFSSERDLVERPTGSGLVINPKGIYYLVNEGTPYEDLLPARTKARVSTLISINNPPQRHLGKEIIEKDVLSLSRMYYDYLDNLVAECAKLFIPQLPLH